MIICQQCCVEKNDIDFKPTLGLNDILLNVCKDCRLIQFQVKKKKKDCNEIPSNMKQCSNCKKLKDILQFSSKTGKRILKTCRQCIQAVANNKIKCESNSSCESDD